MSDEIVRVRVEDREFNVGRAYAVAHDLRIIDEPTHDRAGAPLPVTRAGGRKVKPRTTVNAEAKKKAAAKKTASRSPRVSAATAAKKAAASADNTDNKPSEEE